MPMMQGALMKLPYSVADFYRAVGAESGHERRGIASLLENSSCSPKLEGKRFHSRPRCVCRGVFVVKLPFQWAETCLCSVFVLTARPDAARLSVAEISDAVPAVRIQSSRAEAIPDKEAP
ncbi:hypothetical protein EMEDMD4_1080083 [Sinorhizobium medicae]|uniref:Uncharacterized protein n=1 Tax=Sinorhizobium medicae TaxID=110321 RepID=A0A508WPI3_9HYPH|nr:hypothetical protein EMEDMD4_1080083 [Sinorhizobium medicae]